jgi:hypothetical protein
MCAAELNAPSDERIKEMDLSHLPAIGVAAALIAGYPSARSFITDRSLKDAMDCPAAVAASRFWSSRVSTPQDDGKLEGFAHYIRLRLAQSYLRHGNFPTIGSGELLLQSLEASDDVLFQSAADAGIVPRNSYGREQLRRILPNGVMQFPNQLLGVDRIFTKILATLRLPLKEEPSMPVFVAASADSDTHLSGSDGPNQVRTLRIIPFERPLPPAADVVPAAR